MKKQLHALILGGGQSSRMGINKACISYHGRPQVSFFQDLFKKLGCKVFISAQQVIPEFETLDCDIIIDHDNFKNHGPISGLLSAIDSFPDQNWLLIGCDYPYADKQDFRDFLAFVDADDASAAAFSSENTTFYEPTLAYYPSSVQSALLTHFQSTDDSLQNFLKSVGARYFIPSNIRAVRNVNTVVQMLAAQLDLRPNQSDLMQSKIPILRFDQQNTDKADDFVAREEPLEIRVSYPKNEQIIEKSIAITMRTPGQDEALACGFLFTEGIVSDYKKVKKIHSGAVDSQTILIQLSKDGYQHNMEMDRQFYINSSCGICGKASIEAIKTKSPYTVNGDKLTVNARVLMQLPQSIRDFQTTFGTTGGLHAASLFSQDGQLLYLMEDVGRHNAMDKLTGHCWIQGLLPLDNFVLLLSGRGSFELVQKAYMAGIQIVACIGAPSNLAVELATEMNMTLIGFLKSNKLNVYCGHHRIKAYNL